jgi:hypothetical protein
MAVLKELRGNDNSRSKGCYGDEKELKYSLELDAENIEN